MANIENLQSIDNLLEAIDIIASARSSANAVEEQTMIATIIENDQANQGRYKIEDSLGQRYYAQSDNYDYQINDAVYAMTPVSSAGQDKIILGKYRTEEQQQYGTVSIETKQDFLTMETLATQMEETAGAGIISTWPQPPTTDSKIVVELLNTERDINTLEDVDKILKQLNTYDRLLLDVNITTSLKDTTPIIPEEYNFILTLVSKNAINDEGVQSIVTNTFTFGSKDIFGNPFALSTSDQSAVFNLEDLGEISSMKLEVEVTSSEILTIHSIALHVGYSVTQIQKPGIIISTPELLTFTANDDEEARQRDLIAHIFWPTTNNGTSRLQDLTEIPELYSFKVLKYDASSLQSDPVAGEHWVNEANLTIADLTTNQSESSPSMVPYVTHQSSALPIELPAVSYQAMLVYNTNADATVSAMDAFLKLHSDIVNVLFPTPRPSSWEMDDRIFYSVTELLQYLLTEKYLLSSELIEQDQIILWGESDEDKANNFATLWDLWQTQYPILRSNIITFTQTNFDPLLTTKSSVDNVFISVDAGYSGGVFNNYYSNNVLINSREKNIQRLMSLSYRTFKGDYYSFDDYDTIAWYFPLDNTMIHEPEKGFEYQLATLSNNEFYADRYKNVKVNYATNIENDNEWIFEQIPNMPTGRYGKITRFAIEDDSLGGDELHCYRICSQTFRINEIYNPQYVNNSIYCVIQQRGIVSAVREIPLTFNSTGGQGLDVTFRLELHESEVTMAHDQSSNTDSVQSYSISSRFATYFAAQYQKHSVAIVPKLINEEHEVLTPQQITENHTLEYYIYYCEDPTNDLWNWKQLDFSNTNLLSIYNSDNSFKTYFYLTGQQELIIIRNNAWFTNTATKYFKYFTVKCIVSDWETPVKYFRDNQGFITLPSVTETTLQREIKKVDLINYCPIPCVIAHANSTNKFICTGIQGSNVVKYSSFNTIYPEYEKINYSLLNAIDTIDALIDPGQYYFYLQKPNNRASSYELTDSIIFDSVLSEIENFNIYSLQIRKRVSTSEYAYFTFPILVYNDAYENTAFNNWDGKLTINPDGEESYILASMLGAGTKDSENKFTGIAMGELSSNSLIGLYGFKKGVTTFGFKTDGTAFIGKANSGGSISFDGNKSIIRSGEWDGEIQYDDDGNVTTFTPGTKGSVLELQNGFFDFGGGKLTFDGQDLKVQGHIGASSGTITGTLDLGEKQITTSSDPKYNYTYRVKLRNIQNNVTDSIFWVEEQAPNTTAIKYPFRLNGNGAIEATNLTVYGGSLNINDKFIVTSNGSLTAEGATIQGDLIANSLATGNKKSSSIAESGIYIDNQGNLYAGESNNVIIYKNGTFNFGNGAMVFNNGALTVNGNITMQTGTIINALTIGANGYLISKSGVYRVTVRGVDNSALTKGVFFISKYQTAAQSSEETPTHIFRINGNGSLATTNASINLNNKFIIQSDGDVIITGALYGGLTSTSYLKKRIEFFAYTKCSTDWVFADNVEVYGKTTLCNNKIEALTGDYTSLRPVSNKGAYLGSASITWHTLYVRDGAYPTSDKKMKNHLEYLSEDEHLEDFMMGLKPVMYKFKDGEGQRNHMGLYAQDVSKTAYATIGDLAAYQAAVISINEQGEEIESYYDPQVDDKDLVWSLNYCELIAPTIALLQKTIKKIAILEQELKDIKKEII